MAKRAILAVLMVYVVWSVLDFLIHGVMLSSLYQETAELWRPQDEMKMGLMRIVVLMASICFVAVYALFFEKKTVGTGLKYGVLYGVGVGVGMGYGTYSVMPLPYEMALIWFLGSVVEAAAAGALVGLIVREVTKPTESAADEPS